GGDEESEFLRNHNARDRSFTYAGTYSVADLVVPLRNSSFDFDGPAGGLPEPRGTLIGGAFSPEDRNEFGPPVLSKTPYITRLSNAEKPSVLYHRPSFTGNDRVFYDLLAYAPGMNTSRADIEAVVEAEALPLRSSKPGQIDARARQLIDKVRDK